MLARLLRAVRPSSTTDEPTASLDIEEVTHTEGPILSGELALLLMTKAAAELESGVKFFRHALDSAKKDDFTNPAIHSAEEAITTAKSQLEEMKRERESLIAKMRWHGISYYPYAEAATIKDSPTALFAELGKQKEKLARIMKDESKPRAILNLIEIRGAIDAIQEGKAEKLKEIEERIKKVEDSRALITRLQEEIRSKADAHEAGLSELELSSSRREGLDELASKAAADVIQHTVKVSGIAGDPRNSKGLSDQFYERTATHKARLISTLHAPESLQTIGTEKDGKTEKLTILGQERSIEFESFILVDCDQYSDMLRAIYEQPKEERQTLCLYTESREELKLFVLALEAFTAEHENPLTAGLAIFTTASFSRQLNSELPKEYITLRDSPYLAWCIEHIDSRDELASHICSIADDRLALSELAAAEEKEREHRAAIEALKIQLRAAEEELAAQAAELETLRSSSLREHETTTTTLEEGAEAFAEDSIRSIMEQLEKLHRKFEATLEETGLTTFPSTEEIEKARATLAEIQRKEYHVLWFIEDITKAIGYMPFYLEKRIREAERSVETATETLSETKAAAVSEAEGRLAKAEEEHQHVALDLARMKQSSQPYFDREQARAESEKLTTAIFAKLFFNPGSLSPEETAWLESPGPDGIPNNML